MVFFHSFLSVDQRVFYQRFYTPPEADMIRGQMIPSLHREDDDIPSARLVNQ
jgi:hypothetical protein